uniref:Selenocysteine lyase n=1 Tax=Felis catus TaxID=9685 RepID=A0ABI7X0A0_FELCA
MEAAVALTGDARGRAASQPGDGGENTPPERKVYMDYNATTPLEPEVIQVMTEAMREAWGNPSSPYPTVTGTRSHPCVCVREGTVSHHSAVVKPENAAVSTAVFRCIRAVGVSGARVLSLGRAPLHVEAPLSPRLHLPDT